MDKNKNSTANEIALSALREDVLSLTFMPGASESPKFYIPYSNIKVHSGGVNAWKYSSRRAYWF